MEKQRMKTLRERIAPAALAGGLWLAGNFFLGGNPARAQEDAKNFSNCVPNTKDTVSGYTGCISSSPTGV